MTPKILILDIETSPLIAYIWRTKEQYIDYKQVQQDWFVLSWAAKWLDEKGTFYRDQRSQKEITDDKAMLKHLWGLLDKADYVLTQNGKKFDIPRLNARFIIHGFDKPSPYGHIDVYKLARKAGDFTSHSLDYLTKLLNKKHKKSDHNKFSGLNLWKQCLQGNKKAWDEMRKYNIQDVLATEELYNLLKTWAPTEFPNLLNVDDPTKVCKECGLETMVHIGIRPDKKNWYNYHTCTRCKLEQRGKKV